MDGAGRGRGSRANGLDDDTVPPANKGLLVLAGILLAIPLVALMWVSSYNRVSPHLWGFPFFIWYQFLWVFLCSGLTYAAYLIVLKARPHRPMTDGSPAGAVGDRTDVETFDGGIDAEGER